eukprot:2809443-Rhodomonas_salina.1
MAKETVVEREGGERRRRGETEGKERREKREERREKREERREGSRDLQLELGEEVKPFRELESCSMESPSAFHEPNQPVSVQPLPLLTPLIRVFLLLLRPVLVQCRARVVRVGGGGGGVRGGGLEDGL